MQMLTELLTAARQDNSRLSQEHADLQKEHHSRLEAAHDTQTGLNNQV